MNRHIRHRDLFARLALLAALLLATVPTLGRMLGPVHAAAAMPMGHMQGMAPGIDMAMATGEAHANSAHAEHAGHAHGHPLPHEHDADCAYCVLLATTLALPMQALDVATASPPPSTQRRFACPRVLRRFHGSLGSRGPPSA